MSSTSNGPTSLLRLPEGREVEVVLVRLADGREVVRTAAELELLRREGAVVPPPGGAR
jgi:hypothetical protein